MGELLPFDPRESHLDEQTASLIEHIRRSLTIQAEMFRRILETTPTPSIFLAELLEDTANRYIDFSELVFTAAKQDATD
jgi:hypothetical protein